MVLAINLQSDKIIPEDGQLNDMGIICVSIINEKNEINTWKPENNSFGYCQNKLSSEQVNQVIEKLKQEKKIISWNGLGFDLQILYNNSSDTNLKKDLIKIAKKHVDLAYAFLCENGYMISMKKVFLESLNNQIDSPIDAKSYPVLWTAGKEGQELVINANQQSVSNLLTIYQDLVKNKKLKYLSKAGNLNEWKPITFKNLPLSVNNASLIDLPDNGFLPEEIQQMFSRTNFNHWLDIG